MPPRKSSRNVEMLGIVAKGLKGLKEEVVFVGGATVDLFITDPAAPGTRETDDVDCVIELVGTKLEAFHGRGKGAFMGSKDIEDIVALLDGCPDAEQKISEAPADVCKYLGQEFKNLLADKAFHTSLEGHLNFGPAVNERLDRCLGIMRRFSAEPSAR